MKNNSKRIMLVMLLFSLSIIFYGCGDSNVDESIVEFENYILQEDCVYATKMYEDNKENKRFMEKSYEVLEELTNKVIENVNESNLPITKAFVEFINNIKGESFGNEIAYKIDEIENKVLSEKVEDNVEEVISDENEELPIETILDSDIVTERMIKQFGSIYFEGECYADYREPFNLSDLGNEVFNGIDELDGKCIYIMFAGRQINHIVDRESGSIYELNNMEWNDTGKTYNFIPLEINIKDIN